MWVSNLTNSRARGFTIIEVVLVLAIAGLIFLIIFLALPALQRNQRDTTRKSSLGLIASQVVTFKANNSGLQLCSETPVGGICGNQATSYTATYTTFITSYLKAEYRAPDNFATVTDNFYAYSTTATAFATSSAAFQATPDGTVVLSNGGYCTGGTLTFNPAALRSGVAAWINTEVGVGYCREV